MSTADRVPMEVLSRALGEAIGGRRVRAAVFTTFTFDPGFFELHVLPLLFEQSFSQVDKVRRIQLEDALRQVDDIAVYYDRRGLSQDAEPGQLDYRRIDLRRKTGVFHPKVMLLLVDEPPEAAAADEDEGGEPYQSLVVAIASANLTRAGWWENVECAHFEEIPDRDLDGSRCPFRADLLALLRQVRACAASGESHAALDRIHRFLTQRTQRERFQHVRTGGEWYTRLFCGQGHQSLADWLGSLRLGDRGWNLEVISPYFDAAGAPPLAELVETLQPKEVRVYLPRDPDGRARVTGKAYEAVSGLATWSSLPGEVTSRGRTEQAEKLAPRHVHAKVYRLWHGRGRDILILGSANLTTPGLSHAAAGNLEACFLVDVTDLGGARRFWLEPLENDASRFIEPPPEEGDGLEAAPLDVSLRFDWATSELAYRIDGRAEPFAVCEASGRVLFQVSSPRTGRWVNCAGEAASQVADLLRSSSFLLLRHARGDWRVLVREENMGHRPSLLLELTPEEILEYWSLLSPEQRASFLEEHVGGDPGGPLVVGPRRLIARDTLFDRFAGIYHAFGCLRRHVEEAIAAEREAEADTRLFGKKYDSLPSLLEKTFAQTDGDPIARYVTFLCAQQLRTGLGRRHPAFFRGRRQQAAHLEALLTRLADLRPAAGSVDAEFLEWFETAFLREVAPAGTRP